MANVFLSKLVASVAAANPRLDTRSLFDPSYVESVGSPIDEFLIRLNAINQISPHPSQFDPLLGQLILLGVIAAVESYFRTIFRRLISIDPVCKEAVHRREVSYGAALHLSPGMLPEAILEKISFVSKDSIANSIRELGGVKGALPPDVTEAIDEYVRVCQLRHCAVHRFGKLGANNAIALGLDDHKELLEKPMRLTYGSLQVLIAVSTGTVKTVNNYLLNAVLSRIPDSRWKFSYRSDRKLFNSYYVIFADTISSTGRTPDLRVMYDEFMRQRVDHSLR